MEQSTFYKLGIAVVCLGFLAFENFHCAPSPSNTQIITGQIESPINCRSPKNKKTLSNRFYYLEVNVRIDQGKRFFKIDKNTSGCQSGYLSLSGRSISLVTNKMKDPNVAQKINVYGVIIDGQPYGSSALRHPISQWLEQPRPNN
jgi:hypothetical protein